MLVFGMILLAVMSAVAAVACVVIGNYGGAVVLGLVAGFFGFAARADDGPSNNYKMKL